MPLKRRGTSEPGSAPEVKRRVTRSSNKANIEDAHELLDQSPKAKPKTSKKPRALESKKPSSKKAKPEPDEPPAKDSIPTPWNVTTLTFTDDPVKKPIQCYQYEPYSPTLIFTHGAGGTLSAPAVVNFCTGFSSTLPILAFQGSMNLKARTDGFHACKSKLNVPESVRKSKAGDKMRDRKHRVLLGGRSMGARAAVIAANEDFVEQDDERDEVRVWLVLISYPLQGPKGDVRDQILLELPKMANVLFVVGDEDAMCPLELLNETRSKMTARSQLVVVRGADHGMNVKPARMTKELGEETGRVAARWVEDGLKEDVTCIGEERD